MKTTQAAAPATNRSLPYEPPSGATPWSARASALVQLQQEVERSARHYPVLEVSLPAALPLQGVPGWLARTYAEVLADRLDDALDLVFANVDELLAAGDFAACDRLLDQVEVERLNTDTIVGFLAVTNAARQRLHLRESFVRRAERHLRRIAPERADRLLAGLR